jgi:hypothetical protein
MYQLHTPHTGTTHTAVIAFAFFAFADYSYLYVRLGVSELPVINDIYISSYNLGLLRSLLQSLHSVSTIPH